MCESDIYDGDQIFSGNFCFGLVFISLVGMFAVSA
jgi:hypothetical protein